MLSKVRTRALESVRDQLRSLLLAEIDRGSGWAGNRLPSERELAQTYGTSRTSVRQAIEILVREGVLVRGVGKGTFIVEGYRERRKPTEASLEQAAQTLAFVIHEDIFHFVEPGVTRILVGAQKACKDSGYRLLFQTATEGMPAMDRDIGGCIVVGGAPRGLLVNMRTAGKPVVLVDLLQDDSTAAVGFDYADGMRQAMSYLHTLGHRQIGFVGFPNTEKYIAYWQSLTGFGIRYQPEFVAFLEQSDLQPAIISGYRVMQKLLMGGRLPTALVATNDLVAVGMMDALELAGVAVPGRISVIGFDDLGREASRPLTTVRVDAGAAGALAVRVMLERIQGSGDSQTRITVPSELVIRESAAPPYEGWDENDK